MALRDPVAAVVIFTLALGAYLVAGTYTGGAEIFPRGIAMIMMICSAILFARGVFRPTSGEPMTGPEMVRVGVVIVGTLVYIVAVDFLGFVTASFAYVPLTAYYLGIRNHVLVWASTLIFVTVVAFLFRTIFHVPLPRELVLTWF